MEILVGIEVVIFIFAGVVCGFAIAISNQIYDMDTVLTKKNEFFRCVFQWQCVILNLQRYIKPSGIVVLIVATTVLVLPLNIIAFAILTVLEAMRGIVWVFMKLFGKPLED